jgi:glucose-1-phosphate thymidylyltransferase
MKSKKIDFLILGGGYGTRLFGKSSKRYIPKGLVKIGDFSGIDRILTSFSKELIGKVIIETNKEGLKHYSLWAKKNKQYKTEILVEPFSSPENCLGILKTLEFVFSNLKFKKPILVVAPDNVFFERQDQLIFDERKADAKILTYDIGGLQEAKKYGVVNLNGERIVSCIEKPKKPSSKIIRTSCEIWTPKMFSFLYEWNKKGDSDKVGDYINFLIKKKLYILSIPTKGYWVDMGTKKDLKNIRKKLK